MFWWLLPIKVGADIAQCTYYRKAFIYFFVVQFWFNFKIVSFTLFQHRIRNERLKISKLTKIVLWKSIRRLMIPWNLVQKGKKFILFTHDDADFTNYLVSEFYHLEPVDQIVLCTFLAPSVVKQHHRHRHLINTPQRNLTTKSLTNQSQSRLTRVTQRPPSKTLAIPLNLSMVLWTAKEFWNLK